jgi:Ohr subfamily peroxiredoxin
MAPTPITPLYKASATSSGGRAGKTRSHDGLVDLTLTVPKELGGDGAKGSNPEQLFAAGYSACFAGAVGLVARMQKVSTGPVEITGHVTIGKAGQGYGLAVELVGHFPELSREQAEQIMHAAHEVCPYSVATRGNIEVKLSVA